MSLTRQEDTGQMAGLRGQLKLLSRLLEMMGVGVYAKSVRDDYRVVVWSQKMERLFGIGSEEAIGKTDFDLFDQRLAERLYQSDINTWYIGDAVQISLSGQQARKGRRDLGIRSIPFWSLEGQPWLVVTVFEDLTEARGLTAFASGVLEDPRYAFCRFDARDRLLSCSSAMQELLAHETRIGMPVQQVLEPALINNILEHRKRLDAKQASISFQVSGDGLLECGKGRWFDIRLSLEHDSGGNLSGWQLRAVDVSAEHGVAQAGLHGWALFQHLFDRVRDAVFILDDRGVILRMNPAAVEMTGIDVRDHAGVPIRRALSDASAEALERALKRNQMAEASPVMVWEDAHAVETSGQYCPVRMSLASIEGPGRPSSLLSLVHVSEPGATVDHLQSLNWRDPVTGCLNRQGLLERLACCHTGTGRPVMVLVECPRFERVRANGGTRWAEAFARGVLGRMSDRLMDGALVARLDFHRFAIMVVEATGVNAMIEQIRQAFVTPMHIQGVSVHAGVRTALFELGCMGDEPDHWLDNIETRLGEQDSDRDDDIGVGVRLRELLVTNSLSVAHQPLVSMRTGQGALMWLSPDLDGIPSGELMEVADACGLTAMLMLHMIDMAVQRLELQAVRDMPEPVAIPLSVASAMSESTVEALVQRLQRHRPGRSSLVLSLHEAGLYRQGLALKPGLDRLRQAGFGLMVSGIGETATPIRLLYQLNPEWLQVMSGKDMDLVAVVAERLAEGLCAEVVMPRI